MEFVVLLKCEGEKVVVKLRLMFQQLHMAVQADRQLADHEPASVSP